MFDNKHNDTRVNSANSGSDMDFVIPKRDLISPSVLSAKLHSKQGIEELMNLVIKNALTLAGNTSKMDSNEVAKKKAMIAVKFIDVINYVATTAFGKNYLDEIDIASMLKSGSYPATLRRYMSFGQEARELMYTYIQAVSYEVRTGADRFNICNSMMLEANLDNITEKKLRVKINQIIAEPIIDLPSLKKHRSAVVASKLLVSADNKADALLLVLNMLGGNDYDFELEIIKDKRPIDFEDDELSDAVDILVKYRSTMSINATSQTKFSTSFDDLQLTNIASYAKNGGIAVPAEVISANQMITAYIDSRITLKEVVALAQGEQANLFKLTIGGFNILKQNPYLANNQTKVKGEVKDKHVFIPLTYVVDKQSVLVNLDVIDREDKTKTKDKKSKKVLADVLDEILVLEHISLLDRDLKLDHIGLLRESVKNDQQTIVSVHGAEFLYPNAVFDYKFMAITDLQEMISVIKNNIFTHSSLGSILSHDSTLRTCFINDSTMLEKGVANASTFSGQRITKVNAIREFVRSIRSTNNYDLPITSTFIALSVNGRYMEKSVFAQKIAISMSASREIIRQFEYEPQIDWDPVTILTNVAYGGTIKLSPFTHIELSNSNGNLDITHEGDRHVHAEISTTQRQNEVAQSRLVHKYSELLDVVHVINSITAKTQNIYNMDSTHRATISVATTPTEISVAAYGVLKGEVFNSDGVGDNVSIKNLYPDENKAFDKDVDFAERGTQSTSFASFSPLNDVTLNGDIIWFNMYKRYNNDMGINNIGTIHTSANHREYITRVFKNYIGQRVIHHTDTSGTDEDTRVTDLVWLLKYPDEVFLVNVYTRLDVEQVFRDIRMTYLDGVSTSTIVNLTRDFSRIDYSETTVTQATLMFRNIMYKMMNKPAFAYYFNNTKMYGSIHIVNMFKETLGEYNKAINDYGVNDHIRYLVHYQMINYLDRNYNNPTQVTKRENFDNLTHKKTAAEIENNRTKIDAILNSIPSYLHTPRMVNYSSNALMLEYNL